MPDTTATEWHVLFRENTVSYDAEAGDKWHDVGVYEGTQTDIKRRLAPSNGPGTFWFLRPGAGKREPVAHKAKPVDLLFGDKAVEYEAQFSEDTAA